MNLYQINFKHIAQKDSMSGIYCYLIANNDEEVYEWLKKENNPNDELDILYTNFEDYENDDVEFKQIIVKNKGVSNSKYESFDDLYYCKTHINWELKSEDIKDNDYQIMKSNGVRIFKFEDEPSYSITKKKISKRYIVSYLSTKLMTFSIIAIILQFMFKAVYEDSWISFLISLFIFFIFVKYVEILPYEDSQENL